MTVYAAVDIGTHSVRLLLRRGNKSERFVAVTRLGEGSAQSRCLTEAAMERTAAAVSAFLAQAKEAGAALPVWCYATSAARECENGAELIERLNRLPGLQAEIIPGEREAALACRGAAAPGMPILDIGGGSTELACLRGEKMCALSVPMGTVTLQERYGGAPEQVAGARLADMEARMTAFSRALCEAVLPEKEAQSIVGVGGTATQLAMLFLELPAYDAARVQGFAMPREKLEALLARLLGMNTEQRQALPGMSPQRADVIVTGCRIACAVLRAADAKTLIASDQDGLDGYLAEKIENRA